MLNHDLPEVQGHVVRRCIAGQPATDATPVSLLEYMGGQFEVRISYAVGQEQRVGVDIGVEPSEYWVVRWIDIGMHDGHWMVRTFRIALPRRFVGVHGTQGRVEQQEALGVSALGRKVLQQLVRRPDGGVLRRGIRH
ncbi:hypothetical protein D3C71_1721740 [compost metagenome]